MKTSNLFFIGVFVLMALGTSAQTNAVKVGPFGFLLGNYNARYEMGLNEKSSVQLGANIYRYELFDNDVSGFGVDASYRYYFREAISGPYLSPVLNFDFNNTTLLGEEGNFSLLGLSGLVGWQWVTNSSFVIDFNLGFGFRAEVSKDDTLNSEDYSGTGPRIGFTIGYAW